MTEKERKMIFSRNLTSILHQSQKTQLEVAKAIGVSQQTFNTWCRGVAIPRMGKIQILADYFHINMSELIEDRKCHPAKEAIVITPFEEDLILAYRKSDMKEAVCTLLGISMEKRDDGAAQAI